MTGEQSEESRPVEAVDPDEYISQRRLQDLFNARQEVRDRRTKVESIPEASDLAKQTAYRTALESYVEELHPLLLEHELGTELWSNREFGSVIFYPTESENCDRSTKQELGLSPKIVEVTGLQSLFQYQSPIAVEFKPTGRTRIEKGLGRTAYERVQPFTVRKQINRAALDQMFLSCNEYLVEIGIEIDLEQEPEPNKLEDVNF